LKHAGRSVMVELNEGAGAFDDQQRSSASGGSTEETSGEEMAAQAPVHDGQPARVAPHNGAEAAAAPPQAGSQADGVRIVGAILRQASARWPMYLRNVKQILRQHRAEGDGTGFDERRYGFGGLIDLLRACQREGLVRLERDRRGGLRVFQGAALQRGGGSFTDAQPVAAPEPVETAPGGEIETREADETDTADIEPMPTIDPTAQLLGTASRRRISRTRPAPPPESAPAPKRARGTKKTTAKRAPRAKKAAAEEADE
jgi:hypothetical protein